MCMLVESFLKSQARPAAPRRHCPEPATLKTHAAPPSPIHRGPVSLVSFRFRARRQAGPLSCLQGARAARRALTIWPR